MAYRVISVTYGHNAPADAKRYDYATEKEYRTGDVVVVPVEHHASKKPYNTLAVVQATNKWNSSGGLDKMENLTEPQSDIKPKDVGFRLEVAKRAGLNVQTDRRVNITTLPGYSTRKSNENWSRSLPQSSTRLITRGG